METQTFPLPAPWKEEECLKWITDLAEQLGFKLGLQLAKQLKQMVGFEPTNLQRAEILGRDEGCRSELLAFKFDA